MRKLICLGIVVWTFAIVSSRQADADIVSVSSGGPGGTVTNLTISTTFNSNDSVSFDANFTSLDRIDLFLHINSAGNYFIGVPTGVVENSTSSLFAAFEIFFVHPPVGITFNSASWDTSVFSNGTTFSPPFPLTTKVTFSGPTGVAAGDSTNLGVGFSISDPIPSTVEVVLMPQSVPEPSTLILAGLGGVGLAIGAVRRRHAAVV